MKKTILIVIISVCSNVITFGQEKTSEDLFKSDFESTVIKRDTISLDNYRKFIVTAAGGKMFRKYFEKLNYFSESQFVEDFEKDFEKEIEKSESLSEKLKDVKNHEEALKIIYNNYKKFLIFYYDSGSDKTIPRFRLFHPIYGDVFIVEGKSSPTYTGVNYNPNHVYQEVYDSMMNEFYKFIKSNSKTYKPK